ncbi:hypothetical protein COHA_001837 [Chlorella ohadii]|uniref:Peptidase S1 domain-containing protein n=1 Tax=Chlorella ohadii TaxID=2649997 RepID=A0AAD5H958_9CHLO|nr:hypothetical protein COHA_001837 [Chlorella ohadii]
MSAPIAFAVAFLVLCATPASAIIGGCSGVAPANQCGCCNGLPDMMEDNWCASNYDAECLVVTCGNVPGPTSAKCECCVEKPNYLSDQWCAAYFEQKCQPGSTCDTVSPDVESRCACCNSKDDWSGEDWCRSNYNSKCKPKPTTCDTVAPDTKSRCKCCASKDDWTNEAWCRNNYDALCQPKPQSCDQKYSDTKSRCQCCAGKNDWSSEKWCQSQYQSQCVPKPTCESKSSDTRTRCTCCADTKDWSDQAWCRKGPAPAFLYAPLLLFLCHRRTTTTNFPWMVSLQSRLGPCAGSLVAPGYVLTAASCVWDVNSNEAVEPSNITLWVGGETIPVAFFNISDSWTAFEANVSNHEPSGNYALLALAADSKADSVALPASDMALPGEEVQQTAWTVEKQLVETANLTVLTNCSESYTDEFCAGGSKLLAGACPGDRGAPATQNVNGTATQVGLTGGFPDCAAEFEEGTTFMTRLSDPEVLAEILDWMGQREGTSMTGLSDGSRVWMANARQYIETTPYNK